MTTDELIAKLREADPGGMRTVRVSVAWAADTAISDQDGDINPLVSDGEIRLAGWLSSCDTTLEIADRDESDEG